MIRLLFWIILIIFAISYSKAAPKVKIPGKIELSNLVTGIKNSSYHFNKEILAEAYLTILNVKKMNPGSMLVTQFENKQKVKYPRWDWSNLFYHSAIIEGHEYRVFFETNERKCVLSVDKMERMIKLKKCTNAINKCVNTEMTKKAVEEDTLMSCLPKKICTFDEQFDPGREIEKSVCEDLYGRRL